MVRASDIAETWFRLFLYIQESSKYNTAVGINYDGAKIMALPRPKIGLIFSGGSILMSRSGKVISVTAAKDMRGWVSEVPELKVIADLEPIFVFGGKTETISPSIWQKLAKEVRRHYRKVDGFVVTHSPDTIGYTGAALSFMLQNLGKPVVLTGAKEGVVKKRIINRVFRPFRTYGIRANLVNAVQVATMDIAEVAVMTGSRLVRATQLVSSQQSEQDGVGMGVLGQINFGISLELEHQRRRKTALVFRPDIDERVFVIQMHPGMNTPSLLSSVPTDAHALLIRGVEAAASKDDMKAVLSLADERQIPVFLESDESTRLKNDKRIISLPLMEAETSLVKTMWAMGQSSSIAELREMMDENFAHENLEEEIGK
ncbi:MAG: asparaginase domain-containing protein [bacterium]|nr:asparaginase domain-containing protein [bacterium]